MRNIALERLKDRFLSLLDEYKEKNHMTQKAVAEFVGVSDTRISELRSAKIPFTGTYLEPFIWKGVIRVVDIYDGQAASKKEQDFWERMTFYEARDLVEIMQRIQKKGINVRDALLKILLNSD